MVLEVPHCVVKNRNPNQKRNKTIFIQRHMINYVENATETTKRPTLTKLQNGS